MALLISFAYGGLSLNAARDFGFVFRHFWIVCAVKLTLISSPNIAEVEWHMPPSMEANVLLLSQLTLRSQHVSN
jgi:hypothetical protein